MMSIAILHKQLQQTTSAGLIEHNWSELIEK